MRILSLILAVQMVACVGFAQTWTMGVPHVWSREKGAAKLSVRADGSFELRHGADYDWAVQGHGVITVRAGDAFRLSCLSESLPGIAEVGPLAVCATMRDADGKVLSWSYGERRANPGEPLVSEFMVPRGAVKMEPRITGAGRMGIAVKDFLVESLDRKIASLTKTEEVDTGLLKVSVAAADAVISVTDKRTGRVWTSVAGGNVFVADLSRRGQEILFSVVEAETMRTYEVKLAPNPDAPEILVTVSGEGDMLRPLDCPPVFATRPGDRLIVPMNEGISFPVTESDGVPEELPTFSGHGVCMSFFGVQDDATGAGYMGIVETADDALVTLRRPAAKATVAAGVRWVAQKGRFGYARRVRYVFIDRGGYVAMCKRYRTYAKEQGKFKTFAEKARERPNVDRLLGAANIWCFERDKVGMARKFKEAGIDRFVWSEGGDAQQVAVLAKMDGVLVSCYDVYRDIYRPEQLSKLGWKSGVNMDAWPDGAAWNSADSNDWRKAWGVKAKDGTWTYCACMCDAVSATYCRKHVGDALRRAPYNCRFIDVTTAASWDTCSNPAHPMTRSDSRRYRMDLLRLLGDEFGLVVGSETGHDAGVPYCDYFEGMLSLCAYRVPESGRNITQVWTNVPPRVAKYQVGAAYRLPLWELVYHECLCAHWYWGDYNNKLPALWDKRDLFNVLYGTMGMYIISQKQWEKDKDRFVRSYRMTSPVARETGYSEMLDHRILSSDRLVQRSVFADGTTVTVNFGEKPFVTPEGDVLPGGGHRIDRFPRERKTDRRIEDLAAKDYARPVRPIGVNGQEPWNVRSVWFMYPPTFGFTNRADATSYRFSVSDEANVVRTFVAASANASLAPVWSELPVGWTEVTCSALAADGRNLGTVGARTFWRQAPYRHGSYRKPARSYEETSRLIGRYVMDLPIVRRLYLGEGVVPPEMVSPSNQVFLAYPSKMGAAVLKAMAARAGTASDPSSRNEALLLAAGVVRHLARVTEPEGAALAGFPRTYEAHPGLTGHPAKMTQSNGEKIMMIYPCAVADAYLSLYEVTKDETLRAAAVRIADRYLALQGADGTWPLNCRRSDGRATEANRLVPVGMMKFLERICAFTGERKYRAAADAAFAYVEKGPLATWNWEGQFEDTKPSEKFKNLTKHNACDLAKYLVGRFPGDARRLAQAREVLRFSEDQFVCWERPCRGVSNDARAGRTLWSCEDWRCPAVLEQYECYLPIDASAAKLIDTYLALYGVERSPLDLAKARTLGDAIVRETRANGCCPTFWCACTEDWPGCMLASALALEHLASVNRSGSIDAKGL